MSDPLPYLAAIVALAGVTFGLVLGQILIVAMGCGA